MITAIILAAGESKRMGQCKQLLPWGKQTILEKVINNISNCMLIDDQIRVVLGANYQEIIAKLSLQGDPRLRYQLNLDFQEGMLSSIKKGLESLPLSSKYLMIFLADQPLINTELITRMLKTLIVKQAEMMVPLYQGKRGHPVIINRCFLPEIANLTGSGGLRGLLKRYSELIYYFETREAGVVLDIDYYQDYQQLKELFKVRRRG